MPLRRSTFVHVLDLTPASALAIHAVTQVRLSVTRDVARLIAWFDQPRDLDASLPTLAATLGFDEAIIRTCLDMLLDRGILTEQPPEAEQATIVQDFQGRDPAVALDRYRRTRMEGSHPYWAIEAPHTLTEASLLHGRLDILLFGDCDVQMETDFLRREAGRRGHRPARRGLLPRRHRPGARPPSRRHHHRRPAGSTCHRRWAIPNTMAAIPPASMSRRSQPC